MMRANFPPGLLLVLALGAAACDRTPLEPDASPSDARLDHSPDEVHGGAFVQNSGEGQININSCFFGGFTTTHGTVVRTPDGQALLSCQFEGLPPIPERVEQTGWFCTLAGTRRTSTSRWVRLPNGQAQLSCHFGDKPPYNAVLVVNGDAHFAHEPQWTTSLEDVPGGSVEGPAVFAGFGCAPLSTNLAGSIAVFERGVCPFTTKLANAIAAGAIGAVVFNDPVGGDVIIQMAGTPTPIPAVFVGRSTGLAVLAAVPTHLVMRSCRSSLSCRGEL